MNNQKIFRIIFIVFTAVMLAVGAYILSSTTPPYKKQSKTSQNIK